MKSCIRFDSKSKIRAVLSLIFISLLSCTSKSKSGSDSELDGVWVSTCRERSETGGTTYYEKNTIVFVGSAMTSSVRSYSDANCTKELTDKSLLVGDSTFSIGDYVVGAGGARKFDSQIHTLTLTLTSDNYVALYNGTTPNSTPVCGGGFVKNQPKQLNASNCAPDETLRKEFDTRYDIFKISGNIVYFGFMGASGSATDGSNESKRPVALDPSYYTKN